MTLTEKLFENFSKHFDLVSQEKSDRKISFEAEKKITSNEIDNFLENFFTEENFEIRKNKNGAGYLFIKEKKRVFVSVTNFSGKAPFLILMSVEIF